MGFFAHLDTVAPSYKKLNRVRYGDLLGCDNGFLGGDCRGGVAIILYLAHVMHIPGTYYLTECEEIGCIGMKTTLDAHPEEFTHLSLAISLDRKGTQDCVYTQLGRHCASENFALDFCETLLLEGGLAYTPEQGLYTDTHLIGDLVPQVLNLGIGYHYNHSKREVIDMAHLDKLGAALTRLPWDPMTELAVEDEWQKHLANEPKGWKGIPEDPWDPAEEWRDEEKFTCQ